MPKEYSYRLDLFHDKEYVCKLKHALYDDKEYTSATDRRYKAQSPLVDGEKNVFMKTRSAKANSKPICLLEQRNRVELTWGPVTSTNRSVSEEAADDSGYKTITTVTQAGPDDPPAPNPDPPIVDVAVNNQTSSHAASVMEMASGGV
ncbi:hypothetical protein RRG08_064238 [Elysia crispata]|uniref:Uncharacterized protein n=1 Tax=Elysia crispata TaxID=231223 RepID=A0AAE1CXD7_9GAST|nr:hypothetical protein RRG08_064238 [Elysia crispata]